MKRYMTRQLAASIIGLVLLGGAGFAQVSAQEAAPAPVDSSEISNIGRVIALPSSTQEEVIRQQFSVR